MIKRVKIKYNKENESPTKSVENINTDDGVADKDVMSPNTKIADEAVNDELLEKLRLCVTNKQENNDTIRSIAARLHSRVTSSDKKVQEKTLDRISQKNSEAMETFVMALENSRDKIANCSIIAIIHECLMPLNPKVKSKVYRTKKPIKANSRIALVQLINLGGVQVLIKLLTNNQHVETIISDVLAQEIIWILGQIAQKDKKFATKVKLLNSIKLFHNLLKQHYNENKTLLSLLYIMKSLARNSYCLQILVKNGIVNTLEKTFVYLGYTPHMKLRILMECFKYFTTSRLCCTKLVKIGTVHLLMHIFERWERFDGQIRLKICNYALNTLQHLCAIKSGRKAIKSNGGLQLLYRFCTNCPEDKIYDCLLSRVCGIINQCLEKKELPVPEMSPARFPLPGTTTRASSVESGSDIDSQAYSVASMTKSYSDADSADNEDVCLDPTKKEKKVGDDFDENKFFVGDINFQRPDEDLIKYNIFFKESGTLRIQLNYVYSSLSESIENLRLSKEEKHIIRSRQASLVKQKSQTNSKSLVSRESATEASRSCKINELKTFEELSNNLSDQRAYCTVASKVRSVIKFVKVAYPDLVGGDGLGILEPLNSKNRKVCRSKLLTCVDRGLHPGTTIQETVYDLDYLTSVQDLGYSFTSDDRLLYNSDETRVGKHENDTNHLLFESRFESGNLRKVIQIGSKEYELILTPDVNSASRHQWFYFEVSNMEAGVPYTFNIVNCEKANSQFNFGMKPIIFSVIEAQLGRAGWVRTGTDICYYRNCYQKSEKGKNYLTTSFTVTFPHAYDVCYLAYHFPYTYSRLMTNIWKLCKSAVLDNVYLRVESLCDSLNRNENPLLTVTSPNSANNSIQNRKIIFLTSRVHPGESNASWVMQGTLNALLSNTTYANSLRNDYVFKIVPMLNIEGVINGCNRYGLTNEDLNRRWSNPNQVLHPVIYHTKGLMEYCSKILSNPPYVFVDYHGHSRRKNVFFFGCSKSGSWSAADRVKPDQPMQYLLLPHLMQKISPAFALPLCSFKVERNKESTARVAIWRQLGVSRSYTMESSFCGCDQGALAGFHLDTQNLKDIGEDFCQALSLMKDSNEDWVIDKIPMEERGCKEEDDTSSSCNSDESDFDD